ncbi:MAG: polysaccharide biosynthesis tyrosine autokinase [Acidimicrobiales bacterium]
MPQGDRDSSIRHQLAVLRRRWPIVLLLAMLASTTAYGLTKRQAPVYRATASVLLQPKPAEQLLAGATNATSFSEAGNEVSTEIEVMKSQLVRDAVREKLGRNPAVTLEARGLTRVVDVSASSTVPATAASEATTFAQVYVDLRGSQRVDDLLKTGELVRGQIAELDKRIDELEKPLRDLDARLGATSDPKLRPQLEQQRDATADAIAADRKTLETRRSSYDDQLNRLQLFSGFGISGGAQLVSKAEAPTEPISASPLRNGLLGLVGGLLAGIALVFLLDQLDDRLRRKEEMESAVGAPVLGLLPRALKGRSKTGVVALESPSSPTAEACRTLRTSLQFMSIDRPIRRLQVTSPTTAEGKTTVVTNLAVSFAQAGNRVIVLDCDLRRPRVHERFGLSNERGFTSALLEQCPLSDVITAIEGEPFLAVVTAGPVPPNPSELLSSERALSVLNTLCNHCDILLIDSPPVLPVTDALVVSRSVDAVLLVGRPKRSTRRQVARARELLDQVGAPLVGGVLNGVVHDPGDGYGHGYGYGATGEPGSRPPRSRRGPPKARRPDVNGAAPEVPEPARTETG